jgi:protein CpxP
MRLSRLASLFVLAAGLAAAPTLSAQNPTPGGPPAGGAPRGPGRMQTMALQGITLTTEQQAKVDSITAATRAQMPAFTPGTPMSDADRAKMRTLAAASVQQVRAVLTPDQQKIYDKNVAAMQERMRERMQGGAAPQPKAQ